MFLKNKKRINWDDPIYEKLRQKRYKVEKLFNVIKVLGCSLSFSIQIQYSVFHSNLVRTAGYNKI